MKLSNAHLAVVEREKIVDYLLNLVHRYGARKARFFAELGFQVEAWEILAAALREHGQRHEVGKIKETGFGPRYQVDGELRTPTGRQPRIRTVWQLDHGNIAPVSSLPIPLRPIMIKEHDCVILTQDLPEEKMKTGDIGTVVHIHQGGTGYEVEFMTLAGETVAVITLLPTQVRPIARRDIAHVRELQMV